MLLNNKISYESTGSIAIEMAMLLPIFILFMFGILDFGYFFTQHQLADRSVQTISTAVANNPSSRELTELVRDHRDMMLFGANTGTLCAQSYSTPQQAQTSRCTGNTFSVGAPTPGATEYYVALSSNIERKTLTGFFDENLPPIQSFNVVRVDVGLRSMIDQLTNELSNIRSTLANSENRLTTRISALETDVGNARNAPKWGGSYQEYPDGGCRVPNPKTGTCSCDSGTSRNFLSEFMGGGNAQGFYCDFDKDRQARGACGYIAYQCF
jgi:hypothetical protein